jgi:hypothetical protein
MLILILGHLSESGSIQCSRRITASAGSCIRRKESAARPTELRRRAERRKD